MVRRLARIEALRFQLLSHQARVVSAGSGLVRW